ncbi:hypothetical protein [Myxococcus sp. CA040A]|uniref:hypothetical protein n=1 Tax=Myxococcus sp. CA040A TaxID=2741738 RepID=UPI00157A55DC|nr:hypothetical protein [Myxococcus sp. CA040A]NTX06244.1 hypothetical protein [Myxococcus sp. CA040A]
MSARRKPVIGLFVEGSRPTDPLRDDFGKMWQHLADHFGRDIELKVFGISKGQIVRLQSDLPVKKGATKLIAKGQTQLVGGGDPLDVAIQRAYEKDRFDRVIIAFDRWRPNQILSPEEQDLPCPMRPEVSFVLRHLAVSKYLDSIFRNAAKALLLRYESRTELRPRAGKLSALEVIFMNPMFEAIFVSDEQTVRKALEVEKKKPKDWPKFKTYEAELDKRVLDIAILAVKYQRNAYTNAKSRWGHAFVRAASADAALWEHPIASRLGRVITA